MVLASRLLARVVPFLAVISLTALKSAAYHEAPKPNSIRSLSPGTTQQQTDASGPETKGVKADAASVPALQATRSYEGGSVQGAVLWDGPIPPSEPFEVNVDPLFCAAGTHRKENDRIEIDRGSRAVRNAIVFIREIDNGKPWGEAGFPTNQAMNLENCTITPRMQFVKLGEVLYFNNRDQVVHNLAISGSRETFRLQLPLTGGGDKLRVQHGGFYRVTCDRHPWESGSICVAEHPYYALTAQNGRFEIGNIPPGQYQLTAWHDGMRMQKRYSNGLVNQYMFSPPLQKTQRIQVLPGQATNANFHLSEAAK